jgi:hypothetical protein
LSGDIWLLRQGFSQAPLRPETAFEYGWPLPGSRLVVSLSQPSMLGICYFRKRAENAP